MGYFPVRYDSRVVIYDRRGFIILATAARTPSVALRRIRKISNYLQCNCLSQIAADLQLSLNGLNSKSPATKSYASCNEVLILLSHSTATDNGDLPVT